MTYKQICDELFDLLKKEMELTRCKYLATYNELLNEFNKLQKNEL
jgi:hypothetical protein